MNRLLLILILLPLPLMGQDPEVLPPGTYVVEETPEQVTDTVEVEVPVPGPTVCIQLTGWWFSRAWEEVDCPPEVVEPEPNPEPDPDPIPDPDPDPGAGANEPDGLAPIASHDGSILEPAGWGYWRNTNCGDQGYAEAVNGIIVGHFNEGMGDPCGQRPFTLDHDLHGGPELYVRHGLRLSPDWRGHGASQSKILFLRSDDTPGNGSPAISMLFGSGDGDIELGFFRQNSAFTGASQLAFPANVGDATLVRGEWHVVEFLMRWDRLLAWVDGVLTHDYSGELFHTGPFGWDSWSWDPVYGGRVEVLDRDMEMSMDGIYLSGR